MVIVAARPLPVGGAPQQCPATRATPGRSARPWRGSAALFTTGVGIFSFVGVYDGELFWDHMVQHLILIMVAAPLFAVASPLRLAFCSTSGTAHIVVTEALRSGVAKFFGNPIVAFILYAVVIPISHLTVWYNYTLTQESVHNAEHLIFLLVGYLFWRQIFGNDPNAHRLHPALQFFYLFMAIPIDTFTGLSLAGATPRAVPRLRRHPPRLGPVLRRRPPRGRRHHVGRRRHAHAVADDPRRPALDAHGGAQGGAHRPRARRSRRSPRPRRRAPCPISRRGPSAPRGPRRGRCSRRTRGPSRRGRWSSGSTRRRRRRAPRSGPPSPATSRTRNDRWVRPSWLTARRSRGPKGAGSSEGQELNGGGAPADEL